MKVKCDDGVVRSFQSAKCDGEYRGKERVQCSEEGMCLECSAVFGVHDLHVLRPMFRAHTCQFRASAGISLGGQARTPQADKEEKLSQKPIRVFWSGLSQRFYASRAYKEIKPGIVEITGQKFDVTDDIARLTIENDIVFSKPKRQLTSAEQENV